LALNGNATESLQRLKAAEKWVNGGTATLVSFMVIALVITILGVAIGQPIFGFIAVINALLGALIGLPLVFVGKAGVKRARRLLSTHDNEFNRPAVGHAETNELPASRVEDNLGRLSPGSVTEQTTLNLEASPDKRRVVNQ